MKNDFARWATRLAVVLLMSALAACGGGANDAAPPSAVAPLAQGGSSVDTSLTGPGTLLQSGAWSAYPRLIRLAHQADPRRNGRIVASLTERVDGHWRAGFHVSTDDAASFARVGTLAADEFEAGLCCGTLFEMPQPVGAIPAGSLLYAASVGADTPGALMAQPIYRSDDGGASFHRLDVAACGASAVPRGASAGSGVWEPEFLIAADGSLACIYSDETEAGRSQVLKLTKTSDGLRWSPPESIVAGPLASDRPGMAGVRKLPS